MRILVIYPGRFQPGHRGHKSSYDYLSKKFGAGNVYIATSEVPESERDPFNFAEKTAMLTKEGIPASHIVRVRSPYRADEIVKDVADPEDTVLIFAVSAKDMQGDDPRFRFGVKKNGEPSYMQPYPKNEEDLEPMTKHGYVITTPTAKFPVSGKNVKGATEIRDLYRQGNDADRKKIIHDLYGEFDPHIKAIFDKKLAPAKPQRTAVIQEPPMDANVLDTPAPLQREHRERRLAKLAEGILNLKQRIAELRDVNPDYIDERDKRRVYLSINP
jgi:hypothetical protein